MACPRPTSPPRALARGVPSPFCSLCLVTLVLGFVAPDRADATSILEVAASFEEMRNGASTPDLLSVGNDAASEVAIEEILFDLSGSSGASFDPGDAAWTVTSSDDVGLDISLGSGGFELIAPNLLRLVFSDFDPGETFEFGVDVDDTSSYTTGADFAGATLGVTIGGGSLTYTGVFSADPGDSDRALAAISEVASLPEPTTVTLLGLGLAMLAAGRRVRA
jgi:hypothetical protein